MTWVLECCTTISGCKAAGHWHNKCIQSSDLLENPTPFLDRGKEQAIGNTHFELPTSNISRLGIYRPSISLAWGMNEHPAAKIQALQEKGTSSMSNLVRNELLKRPACVILPLQIAISPEGNGEINFTGEKNAREVKVINMLIEAGALSDASRIKNGENFIPFEMLRGAPIAFIAAQADFNATKETIRHLLAQGLNISFVAIGVLNTAGDLSIKWKHKYPPLLVNQIKHNGQIMGSSDFLIQNALTQIVSDAQPPSGTIGIGNAKSGADAVSYEIPAGGSLTQQQIKALYPHDQLYTS